MTTADIASALQRVRTLLARRPEAALHTDGPVVAHWEQGLRVVCRDASGAQVVTDMPREVGGQGGELTAGWLLRAALASCLATRIAMEAASRDITITSLEVETKSELDARGLLGMTDAAGARIPPEPLAVRLRVRVRAANASAATLRAVIEESHLCSPVECALERTVPVSLEIDVEPT